jgi:PmbA/TldA metallopeptidase C-terminal domain
MTLFRPLPTARAAGLLLALVLLAPSHAPSIAAQESPLLQAMRDELTRAMTGLRIADQPAPYYIAYTLDDVAGRQVQAILGALVGDGRRRSRTVRVDVRVGDYARDSSRFVSFDRDPGVSSMYGMGVVEAPLDDDVAVLRRQLWLVTDAAYRRALATFARKQAALQNQASPDPVPDWSRETARTTRLPVVAPDVSADAWIAHVRTLSSALARPELTRSEAWLMLTQGTRYSVNSEGFTTVAPIQTAQVRLSAETQAEDGMPLRDTVTAHARTVAGLPAPADLAVRARELAAGLVALRTAPVGEAFTGPVLVEGQAAAELLAQTLVPLFLTIRGPELDNPQMFGPMGNAAPTPFLTRVGNRVLPESFTAADTPSLAQFEGREVAGAYAVDDEGIPAQDVTLCEKGLLKSLLSSRTPQKGFLTSNGHGRGGVATAGVFQLQSSAAVPAASLKEKYLARLKADGLASGYIVRAVVPGGPNTSGDAEDFMMMSSMMRGGGKPAGPAILRAYRVTADGAETLVRGLQFDSVPHAAFRDILEASSERHLYSYRSSLPQAMQMAAMMQGGGPTSEPIVSVIAPSLLFAELELEKPDRQFQRPPIVASPLRQSLP